MALIGWRIGRVEQGSQSMRSIGFDRLRPKSNPSAPSPKYRPIDFRFLTYHIKHSSQFALTKLISHRHFNHSISSNGFAIKFNRLVYIFKYLVIDLFDSEKQIFSGLVKSLRAICSNSRQICKSGCQELNEFF